MRLRQLAIPLWLGSAGCGSRSTDSPNQQQPCMPSERRVTNALGDSSRPSLASTSDGIAVSWGEADGLRRDGNPEVYFARLCR